MTEAHYTGIISAIFFLLVGVVGWIGARIFSKLDSLSEQMTSISAGLQKQITDGDNILHHRVNEIDRRVTRVETRCSIEHDDGK
jgi:predicted PurR-regulated permease PerM